MNDKWFRRCIFGPLWAGKLVFARFEGDGGGDGGPGGGAGGDGDGGDANGPDWLHGNLDYDDITSDDNARKYLSRFKAEGEAHKAHLELHRQFRQSFRMPDKLDEMDPKEVAKVTKRLQGILKPEHLRAIAGAPDKPEAYELVRPKLPDGLSYDEEHEASLRAFGAKHGLSQAAMEELYAMEYGRDGAKHTKGVNDLTQMWGDTRKEIVERLSANGRDGEKEWGHREELVGKMLREWGNKAGFKGEDIVGCLLDKGLKDRLSPLVAALGELAVAAQAEGVTKLGQAGADPGLDIESRWPKSTHLMK